MFRKTLLVIIILSFAFVAYAGTDAGSGVRDMVLRAVAEKNADAQKSILQKIDVLGVTVSDGRIALDSLGRKQWRAGTYGLTATEGDRTQPYTLYIPKNYKPEKRSGLLFLLHGAGDSGHNFMRVWTDMADEKNLVIAAPTASSATYWWSTGSDIFELVLSKVLAEVAIDSNKVFLAGFSNGGHGAWNIGLRKVWRFAAVLPMAGSPLTEVNGRDDDFLLNATAIPFYVWHGEKDRVINVQNSRNAVKKMKELGCEVTYCEVTDRQHRINPAHDMPQIAEWLDGKKRNPFPERIDFYCDRLENNRCFWVRLDAIEGKARITAERDGDTIGITTENVKKLSLLLSEKEFDFGKLTIMLNGEEVKFNAPVAKISSLVESVCEYGDIESAYSAVITIDVNANAEVDEKALTPFPEIEQGSRLAQVAGLLTSSDPAERLRAALSLQSVFMRNQNPGEDINMLGRHIAFVMSVEDPDPVVRAKCAGFLAIRGLFKGKIKDTVMKLAVDPSSLVRTEAANLIPHFFGDDSPVLLLDLKDDPDVIVRATALSGLVRTLRTAKEKSAPGKKVVAWVKSSLKDSDWRIKAAALDALGYLDLEEGIALRLIRPFLAKEDRHIRAFAILAIARACPGKGKRYINAAKNSDDELIQAVGTQAARIVKLADLDIDPADFNTLKQEAMAAMTEKNYEKAVEIYIKVIAINPHDSNSLYNLACAYAKLGKKDDAIRYLGAAILNGFKDYAHMTADGDLDSLREDDRYKSWVDEEVLPDIDEVPEDTVPASMKKKEDKPVTEKPKVKPKKKAPKEKDKPKDDDGWR